MSKRVAVSHPLLGLGGSEMVAMWMLEALQDECELSLVTGGSVDWARLNRFCGTTVHPERIRIYTAPMTNWLSHARGGDALRGALFQRFCRRLGSRCDLCVSAYNTVDFGTPAIHFLADLSWTEPVLENGRWLPHSLQGLIRRAGWMRQAYLRACHLVGGAPGIPTYPGTVVISNSRWLASKIETQFDLETEVIYPPVPPSHTRAEIVGQRTEDFVLLGRIAPEKRVEDAIDIIQEVRSRGHDVKLHILGPLDDSPYVQHIRELAQARGPWVTLPGAVIGEEKNKQLLTHAYGIHLRTDEAFGIAVAEEVQMGMIPFVWFEGGPAEIVDTPLLTFRSKVDAVEQIDRVLRDKVLQSHLCAHLEERGRLFTAERFVTRFRALIDSWFSRKADRAPREHS